MKRKETLILLLIALSILGVYVGFLYRYKVSMDEVSRSWYEEEYVGKKIKGVLADITEFNGNNPFRVVLSIKNEGERFEVTYGSTCVDKEFRDFVQVGDSVFKLSGEKSIRFCKRNGKCRDYVLNFCGKH